jgi:hypothetical protein
MEGVILMSILCAATWAYVEERLGTRTLSAAPAVPPRKVLAARWQATGGVPQRAAPSSLKRVRRR